MESLLAVVIGYLLGSVPSALVIGKVFYKTDIREFGSGNLGGSNAGRVLGQKAGLAVMTFDVLKVVVAMGIVSIMLKYETAMILSGISAGIGHCYPVFARFKGGKIVATMYGFLFGMAVLGPYDLRIFLIPLAVFLIVLYIGKIVSLSSMCSAVFITSYIGIITEDKAMFGALCGFTIFMIYRHRSNIVRLIRGEENRISWM